MATTPAPWLEIPVFIHGITPEPTPASHRPEYEALLALVQTALAEADKPPLWPTPVMVEWGWPSKQTESADEDLAGVQHWLAQEVEAIEKRTAEQDFTLNPLRLVRPLVRNYFFYGFADMFYYVSADGEATVRGRVFKHLSNELLRIIAQERARVSLTLFAHSGGSVIAHDWLYHLFRATPAPAADPLSTHTTVTTVAMLRDLVKKDQLRLRRFYTMGSPIAPLALRSNGLIARLRDRRLLEPSAIGLAPQPDLAGPRWLNFIDRDDLAAYPLAFMYNPVPEPVVKDLFVDVGDSLATAHNRYWWSRAVAGHIAKNW